MSKVNTKKENKVKISFLDIWKQYWNPDPEELTEEEAILADQGLSDGEKKELLKALRNTEKMGNTIFQKSYNKTTNLKVEARESAQKNLKQKQIIKEDKKEIQEKDDNVR